MLIEPELLWTGGGFRRNAGVLVDPGSGAIERVLSLDGPPPAGAPIHPDARVRRVPLARRALLPGFINAHSHAFQRVIRGRTQWRPRPGAEADFWSWREAMYAAALALGPDDVFHVARFCFLEMLRTGITAVGEFHYLHHARDGSPYPDPNELATRVLAAAREVGVRIVLLNVCYAAGGIGAPLGEAQRRFRAASTGEFLDRTQALLDAGTAGGSAGTAGLTGVGVAPHSLRAIPRDWLPELWQWAADRDLPFHMHVAEQPAEVEACTAAYGARPVELLAADGLLDERFTAVHATHLTDEEVALLGAAGSTICACPTTERDLGDGFLRGLDLLEAGAAIALGTDSHTSLDFFEEMRLVEYHERLRRLRRVVIAEEDGFGGQSAGGPLLRMATAAGARALRIPAGAIDAGRVADLVAVDLDHPSLLGVPDRHLASALALSATPDAVTDVWVGGVRRLEHRRHPVELEAAAAFRAVSERI